MINEVTPHNPRETIPDGRLEANRYRVLCAKDFIRPSESPCRISTKNQQQRGLNYRVVSQDTREPCRRFSVKERCWRKQRLRVSQLLTKNWRYVALDQQFICIYRIM